VKARAARAVALLTPRGLGPRPLLPLLRARTGYAQLLTGRRPAEALIDAPEASVPYQARSAELGLGGFALALDGERHAAARSLLVEVLGEAVPSHRGGLEAARHAAVDQLAGASPVTDLVTDVAEPALVAWFERWSGLTGHGGSLLRTAEVIHHATFLNPATGRERDADLRARARAHELVAAERARLVQALAGGLPDADPSSFGRRLLARLDRPTADPVVADLDDVASQVLGLTVGPLALTLRSVASVLDRLLDEPATLAAIAAGGPIVAQEQVLRLVAERPPLPGVLRRLTTPVRVPRRRGHRTARVPAGLVVAYAEAYAGDGGADPTFGHGRHACLGRRHAAEVAGEIVLAVAARGPRRVGPLGRAPAPSGFSRWDAPGRLVVRLAT